MQFKHLSPVLALATTGCFATGTSSSQVTPVQAQESKPVRAAPAQETTPATGQDITISVASGARQRFDGFGASIGNWGSEFQKLPVEERAQLSKMLWHDLRFNTFRLWLNTDEYAPTRGAHDPSHFQSMYVASGLIQGARANGVTTLLLAPDRLPAYMSEGNNIKDSEVENYAVLLADFIAQLRKDSNITLQATGIQNEPNNANNGPGVFSPPQLVRAVKQLRLELDKRGLASVKIIAPETGSPDQVHTDYMNALQADPQAWKSLVGASTHSYNMAANGDSARFVAGANGQNTKEYWMTEASDNGSENPDDIRRAVSLSARFLNDVNHRVTRWVHFIGFDIDDPKDNATRIISYSTDSAKITVFKKYYAYQQLARAFDVGSVFRDSTSSLDGDMTWTFGLKPRVTAASARNADGSWAIGVANYTSDSFSGVQGWSDENWNREQGGHSPAQNYAVTIRVDELKNRAAVPFTVYRTNAKASNAKSETVVMHGGQVSVPVASQELVTLRSAPLK